MRTLESECFASLGDVMVRGKGMWQAQPVKDLMSGIPGFGNYPGNPIFVDPVGGDDAWDGTFPVHQASTLEGPKLTFGAALVVAVDRDVILVGYGDLTEDNLVITQRGLKVFGPDSSGLQRGGALFIGTTKDILTIKAHDVELAGLGFYQTGAKACISIAENPAHYWRTHIHHNGFSGEAGSWGIRAGAVAAEAPYTIVEWCRFYNLLAGAIRLNSSMMVVQDCLFDVPNGAIGIEDVPNGSSRPDRSILRNKFKALGATAVGIQVTNTPDPGQLLIDDNRFAGFADAAHCCDVSGSGKTGLMGLNYFGITAIPIS